MTSKVFEELDRVMKLDLVKSLGLKFAQVVVFGMESHGKSTLLERLIGLPLFPKNRTRCTTCPIRVQLRRNPRQITTVCIRRRETGGEHLNSKSIIAMEHISIQVNRLMTYITTILEPGVLVSTKYEIVICIQQPFVPNLDVVDLPGLVGANLNANQDLVKVTAELANSVITKEKDRSVFLLVMDCRAQTNHTIAMELIRTGRIEAQTIGVMTKLDMYHPEEEDTDSVSDPLLQKLVGKSEMLTTNGWLLCSNRIPARDTYKNDIDRLEIIEARERELLRTRDYITYARTGRVGLPAIRGAVRNIFEDFLCRAWIPRVTNRLLEEASRLMDSHLAFGLPIPYNTSGIRVRNKIVEAMGRLPTSFLQENNLLAAEEFEVFPHTKLIADVLAIVRKSVSRWVRLDRAQDVWRALEAFNDLVKSIEDTAGGQRKEYFRVFSNEGNPSKRARLTYESTNRASLYAVHFLYDVQPELCCADKVVRDMVVPSLERLVSAIHPFLSSPMIPQMLQLAIRNNDLGRHYPKLTKLFVKNFVVAPPMYNLTIADFESLVLFNVNIVVMKLLNLSIDDLNKVQYMPPEGTGTTNNQSQWNLNN